MKKFSITGGSGLSLKNHALCGKKTYFKEVKKLKLKRIPLALVVGSLVHDALNKYAADPWGTKDITRNEIIQVIESGVQQYGEFSTQIDFGYTNEHIKLQDKKKAAIMEALMLFDKAILCPTYIDKETNVERYFEVPLRDPESDKTYYEGEVSICGKLDMIEAMKIKQTLFRGKTSTKNMTGKMIPIGADSAGKTIYQTETDIERIINQEYVYEIHPEGKMSTVVSDWKTAAYVNKDMDSHFQQVAGQYPYLYYTATGEKLDYASIIEIPKTKTGICVRHFKPITDKNIIDSFKFIKAQVDSIMRGEYTPNYNSCKNFYRCLYFEACHSELFEEPEKVLNEKFVSKD